MELALLDHRFLRARPSLIAAVGMFLSKEMLAASGTTHSSTNSDFTEEQLVPGANLLLERLLDPGFEEQFVYRKYANKKFLKASVFARDWAYQTTARCLPPPPPPPLPHSMSGSIRSNQAPGSGDEDRAPQASTTPIPRYRSDSNHAEVATTFFCSPVLSPTAHLGGLSLRNRESVVRGSVPRLKPCLPSVLPGSIRRCQSRVRPIGLFHVRVTPAFFPFPSLHSPSYQHPRLAPPPPSDGCAQVDVLAVEHERVGAVCLALYVITFDDSYFHLLHKVLRG